MPLFLNAQEVELLAALNQQQARYVVVGGHAVQFHGHLRAAKDLDLWIEPSSDNAHRVARALSSIRVSLTSDQIKRISEPKLQMALRSHHTEFLTSVDGLVFSEAMAHSEVALEQGVACHVLSRNDLIANKQILARESDLEDIVNLERLGK